MMNEGKSRLVIVPMSLAEANAYVERLHRHHPKTQGHKWSIGVRDDHGVIRGVAIAGRPLARMLDDGATLEITRCCTDGFPNAPSCLYAAARRVAREMGYKRLITYTLQEESGVSLKAAGWVQEEGSFGGMSWNRVSRPRLDKAPIVPKKRWTCEL